jgi:hypothetical protein
VIFGTARARLLLLSAALAIVSTFPFVRSASAIELSISGSTVTVSGSIEQGDEFKFQDFIKAAGAGRVTTLRLDSGGGNIGSAGVMAHLIRGAGMTTLVDAARNKCASACTILFAAGVRRLYLNADGFASGVVACQGFRGLGFHQGASPGHSSGSRYSGVGTAQMIGLLYEFGASSAASLIDNSSPETVYRPSAQKALELGIATLTRGS